MIDETAKGGSAAEPPPPPSPNEVQSEELNYLKSINLHETVDHMMQHLLSSRPQNPEDACYDLHLGAAEMYAEIANKANQDDTLDDASSSDESGDEKEILLCGLQRGATIGQGAFGKVYKALDNLGTVYAVKVLKVDGLSKDNGAEDEARAEYSTLRQLIHKNIVSVWNFVVGQKRCEIVMSYWAQGSVAHQIKEFGSLPPCTVRKYAKQLLSGLQYLHSCQVLHRDLKPGNMLIDCVGSVALTDFGLSTTSLTMAPNSVGDVSAKEDNQVLSIVGSPPYLSPCISSLGKYSNGSDLWALGCALLEMATARIVWSGADFGDNNHGWDIPAYVAMSQRAYRTGETPLNYLDKRTLIPEECTSFVQMCFEAESQEHTHLELQEHPFLGNRVYQTKKICKERKLPYFKYTLDTELSGPATVFVGSQMSLLSEEERKTAVEDIVNGAVSDASPFSSLDIRREGEGKGFNNADLDPKRMYPHRKRPSHCFLSLLNRTSDRQEIEPSMPDIRLSPKLLDDRDDKRIVTVSAEMIDQISREEKAAGTSVDPFFDTEDTDGPSAKEIYGDKDFSISIGEVKRLARSTYVGTASCVPPKFFAELVQFTSMKALQLFWSAHRATPLSKIGDMEEEHVLRNVLENERRTADNMIQQLSLQPQEKRDPQHKIDIHKWQSRRAKAEGHLKGLLFTPNNPREGISSAPSSPRGGKFRQNDIVVKEQYTQFLEKFDAWRQHVALFPYGVGFSSSADAKSIMEQSLSEIGTAVCISQQGFFLVDGCKGNHNQLTPKTPQPVTFLLATGIDFFSPSTTIREASKYFMENTDKENGFSWLGFQPVAQFRLKERIKDSYRAIFTCAQHHGVRNLSMLSMGLGIFLGNISPDDRPTVREAYFKAQFELLCETDWGFTGYYMNTGPPFQREIALKALEDTLSGGGADPAVNYLSCNVIFHSCDAKFLAVELAKRRMSAAMLSPSDCASVTIGQVGTFWETGRGNKYSGEEDFISHTTGVLAREGISECWACEEEGG